MFVDVALNIPQDKLFTYAVPPELEKEIAIGKRVFVPFGSRKRTAFIVTVRPTCELAAVKTILEILDAEPLFDSQDLDFYRWIAEYFLYPLGKTLAEIIPAGAEKKDLRWVSPLPLPDDIFISASQKSILDTLQLYPQGISLKNLAGLCGAVNVATINRLHLMGLLSLEEKQKKHLARRTENIVSLTKKSIAEIKLTDKQQALVSFLEENGPSTMAQITRETGISAAVSRGLHKKRVIAYSACEVLRRPSLSSSIKSDKANHELNEQQRTAFEEVSTSLNKKTFTPFLLHGITGSGKTEIYLKAIELTIKAGGAAIYLVPEIALTPQLIARISGRFDDDKIAVLHSGIAQSVRYDQWREIKRGKIKLIIGARSAIFAAPPDLKLIIVDEEHDSSYKQDDRLCYNARDLAVLKAKLNNAVVILGSATPSIRSYYNARTEKYRLLELPQRVHNRPLPLVQIVDMKKQKEKTGKTPLLSDNLVDEIARTLENNEQTLLFLNKRGFETFLVCADCGYNFRCPNCAVSLKHHLAENTIKCHYCDYRQKAIPQCPSCRGSRVISYGAGTQKLEKEIEKIFPTARVRRMDADTSSGKNVQEKILEALQNKKIDILVGTQMIAKGHDFPLITLVGVVAADTSLNMPDFRAAEKTFQLLTQVAGRSGRGNNPGKVIIQTFNPQHFALRHAQHHDYKSFYAEELDFRRTFQYPPFGHIVNIRLSSSKKEELLCASQNLEKKVKSSASACSDAVEIIGPAPAPLAKLSGRYRYQMLLKGAQINTLRRLAQELLQDHKNSFVRISVDVDPENFM
ncbi:MAG TPA: primosomal protein N' [Smithellaceae bacterium]|nr:primosomal protein N' [Smithellaceae bacterium]HRS88700.1 primosomal protein N' [Smithellaceae bacterium]HRV26734.1 primosomal protein N' [Smithellaceae bacterium]